MADAQQRKWEQCVRELLHARLVGDKTRAKRAIRRLADADNDLRLEGIDPPAYPFAGGAHA